MAGNLSNYVLRWLTALLGIPVTVYLLHWGGWWSVGLVLFISLVSQHEVYRLLEKGGFRPDRISGLLLGALCVLQVMHRPLLYVAGAVAVVVIARFPFEREDVEKRPREGLGPSATFFGVVYPSVLLAFLLEIRLAHLPGTDDPRLFHLALAILVLVWATDTAALWAGRTFGKHALVPAISPAKTWAGAIGGILGALLAAVAFKMFVPEVLPWKHVIATGMIIGVVGQLGDLAASKLKRMAGVKDSGWILPGHGGMLDRLDALLLVVPVIYLYVRFVAGVFH